MLEIVIIFWNINLTILIGMLADMWVDFEWWVGVTKDFDAGGEWVWNTGEPWADEIDLLAGKE